MFKLSVAKVGWATAMGTLKMAREASTPVTFRS